MHKYWMLIYKKAFCKKLDSIWINKWPQQNDHIMPMLNIGDVAMFLCTEIRVLLSCPYQRACVYWFDFHVPNAACWHNQTKKIVHWNFRDLTRNTKRLKKGKVTLSTVVYYKASGNGLPATVASCSGCRWKEVQKQTCDENALGCGTKDSIAAKYCIAYYYYIYSLILLYIAYYRPIECKSIAAYIHRSKPPKFSDWNCVQPESCSMRWSGFLLHLYGAT